MKTISTYKNTLSRPAMTLFMMLAMTLSASATDFITDLKKAYPQYTWGESRLMN